MEKVEGTQVAWSIQATNEKENGGHLVQDLGLGPWAVRLYGMP